MSPRLTLLALNPTDSVTHGFLPAAAALGLTVTLLTDQPDAHLVTDGDVTVVGCDVRDHRAVIDALVDAPTPDAIFTNSDHLQTSAALAAHYVGLPGKDWRATLRCKNKSLMRRHLAAHRIDTVRSLDVSATEDLRTLDVPVPCVIKPREGVASEDVVLAESIDQARRLCQEIRERRPGVPLVVEEYLPGELHTMETLGDGVTRHVLGGFHTELSPLPYFIEERMAFTPHPDPDITGQVLAQLDSLGVHFGACHTEYVVDEGRARLVEVNYRAIGDQCDLLLAQLLDIPYFEHTLRLHLGEKLPVDLQTRRDRAARIDYPCADRAGTLRSAPAATDLSVSDVTLSYRPLRDIGETHPLHHTNRDYLGVIRAVGPNQDTVDRAVAEFRAAHRWEITA
ncbi:hypothetical protein KEM60_03054 [Austwickia sp. TVS 96-490-7B]|uniref:ATP-grasp domain-containing protein n=1 Tax=Austwickia sp. TVS 96-490-7B TaxID=2830843 RepID=UPI001C593639|nr:hypothetical protein [Austwickia sp. TVS 96-490-7B]MBW3086825.1 hypothetical protein [Austwickia sp. TVS 96-490-7B]